MNVIVGLVTAVLPFLKKLLEPEKDPRIKTVQELRKQFRQLRRHFKSKDSEGGRTVTDEENEILMHIQTKITELLTKTK